MGLDTFLFLFVNHSPDTLLIPDAHHLAVEHLDFQRKAAVHVRTRSLSKLPRTLPYPVQGSDSIAQ